jgi:succinate dehydrogenase / fumarate reductase membrane anchor subunit
VSAPTIDSPRSPAGGSRGRSPRASSNFELNSWLFQRGSGLLLVVLVFGHLFVNLMVGRGIHAIDFAFVAGKWANPFWQVWDLAMLWLAELHGMNGLRTIINDYATKPTTKLVLKTLLYFSALIVIVLGTLVIFTFDPCTDPSSTLSVCTK